MDRGTTTSLWQFCVPISRLAGTATINAVVNFAVELLEDKRLHTQISWPKDLELPACVPWTGAHTCRSSYIPSADLDKFAHFKSHHGSSCAHEMRTASSKADLVGAKWIKTPGPISEVNDYHLLRPRMPEWFFGSETSKNVVFGVNAVDWDDKLHLEEEILTNAKISRMPKCFAGDPATPPPSPSRVFASMPKVESHRMSLWELVRWVFGV